MIRGIVPVDFYELRAQKLGFEQSTEKFPRTQDGPFVGSEFEVKYFSSRLRKPKVIRVDRDFGVQAMEEAGGVVGHFMSAFLFHSNFLRSFDSTYPL